MNNFESMFRREYREELKSIAQISTGGPAPRTPLVNRNEDFYDYDSIFKKSARNIITDGRSGLPKSADLLHISIRKQKIVLMEFKEEKDLSLKEVITKGIFSIIGLFKITKEKSPSIGKGEFSEYRKEYYVVYSIRPTGGNRRPMASVEAEIRTKIQRANSDKELSALRLYMYDLVKIITPRDLVTDFDQILG